MSAVSSDLIFLDNYPTHTVWEVFNFVLSTSEEFILAEENSQHSKTLTKYCASIKWKLVRGIIESNITQDPSLMRKYIISKLSSFDAMLKPF